MKRTARILLCLLPVLAFSCTEYSVEEPNPMKCTAGEVWDIIEEICVPTGCTLDVHCDDTFFCNGRETCGTDGECQAGLPISCESIHSCAVGDCNDDTDRCEFDFNHASCPSGQVCDPEAGCVPGTMCTSAEDCPERYCYTERACTNDMCTWELARNCADAHQCTEDKCNEARGECEHIAHNSACQSADRCLTGRCDPLTGCAFDPAQGYPEVCDGIDNDCDGLVDEKEWDDTEGSICACMTPCESQADCIDQGGVTSICTAVDGLGSVCLAACDANGNCAGDPGSPGTCMTTDVSGTDASICVCPADSCPQPCANDRECFVYGLSMCMGGRCTNPCLSDDFCPDPYVCDFSLGFCSCPMDPGASCLACTLSIECENMGIIGPCYDMDRGVPYSECKVHCSMDNPCPYMAGDMLYCHQSTLCSCRPPYSICEDCTVGENVCAPYRMDCSMVESVDTPPAPMCTAPCADMHDCPSGWVCQFVEGEGMRCLDPYCIGCYQPWCNPQDATACDAFGHELVCVDPAGTNEGTCTKTCDDTRDCPPGWWCSNGQCGCY
jgi:hypothetical protein